MNPEHGLVEVQLNRTGLSSGFLILQYVPGVLGLANYYPP